MSTLNFSPEDRRKFRLFNGPQHDPTRLAASAGVPYYRPGKGRVLMPDDFMPVGPHAGKHLRAVPPDYILWVNAQPWAATWAHWQPVADYLSRFLTTDPDAQDGLHPAAGPKIYLTALRGITAELHCLPGDNDYLHTFAEGALHLDRSHFWNNPQYAEYPHYRLAAKKHDTALGHGAELIDAPTRLAHIRQWRSRLTCQRVHTGPDATKPTTCHCTKHAYTKLEAETTLNDRLNGRPHRRHNRPDYLRIYECPACGFWHLTSKQPS